MFLFSKTVQDCENRSADICLPIQEVWLVEHSLSLSLSLSLSVNIIETNESAITLVHFCQLMPNRKKTTAAATHDTELVLKLNAMTSSARQSNLLETSPCKASQLYIQLKYNERGLLIQMTYEHFPRCLGIRELVVLFIQQCLSKVQFT